MESRQCHDRFFPFFHLSLDLLPPEIQLFFPCNDLFASEVKRLDRASILDHYRSRGAGATFLAATCEHELPTGDIAILVYVLPKYKLEKAVECPSEMSACLKLSLAKSRADVEKACCHPRTCCYDLQTHMSLRQSYTSVWVTKSGAVLEGHKDFVVGCGWTEHSLFVSGLIKKGFFSSLPKGPLLSQPRKKVRGRGRGKRSQATKRMLGPPEAKSHVNQVTLKRDVEMERVLFPGMPATADESAFFHMRGAEDDEDALCLAPLVRGGRCARKRTHGNYCKQHSHELRKPEKKQALWECLDESFGNAARWEKEQMELALSLSLEESEELLKKRQASRRKIEELLRPEGLESVETQADGTCQFLAVLFSAGIPLDAYQFRQQVVDYLRTLPGEFAEKIEAKFGSFAVYCDTMSLPATWGDELTLTAMSHLLLRPIEVISDCDLEPRRIFEPPQIIYEECWGAKITICRTGQNHFEATAPLEVGESGAPPVPKAIKREV